MKKFLKDMVEEFKYFLNDKGATLVMIVGVIAYSLFYSLPYMMEVIKEAPIGVIDFDNSSFSRQFIRAVDSAETLKVVENFASLEEAKKRFYQGTLKGFIVVPGDFEKDILRGKQVNVSVYADSAYLIIYKAIYSGVLMTSMETGGRIEVGKMMKAGIPKKQAMAIKKPFEFVSVPLYNQIGGYKSYVYPIILILVLHQTLVVGLGIMQGTRNEIGEKYCEKDKDIPYNLFMRATTYLSLYLIYGVFIFLIYPALLVYPIYYNILPLMIMYILMMYAAAFFAQTISYWFRTRETSLLILISSSIIFIFIPGLIWPRETIPMFVNVISFFVPATCGVDGIIKINQNGAGFMNVIYDYLWLLFLCIFYFCTAVYLTKKRHKEIDKAN